MRDNERDADLIEQIERRLGMGHAAWDTIDPLEIAAAFREALAAPADCVGCEGAPAEGNNPCAVCGRSDPPAASVDDEVHEWVRANLPESYADKPLIEILRLLDKAGVEAEQDLIDSAGEADSA